MAISGLTPSNNFSEALVPGLIQQASASAAASAKPLPPVSPTGGSDSLLAIANNLAAQKAQQQNSFNESIASLAQYFSLLVPIIVPETSLIGAPGVGAPEAIGAPGGAILGVPSAPAGPAAPAAPVVAAPVATAPAPAAVPAVPPNVNTTTDPTQKARLDSVLSKLNSDPEGAILLQKALAKGYTLSVGDPNAAVGAKDANGVPAHDALTCPSCQSAALDGGVQVNGVTIPSQHKIVVNPQAPDFEKTVVHELVHAVSDNDGNSQKEEGRADQIGYEIAARITGKAPPGTAAQIFQSKIRNYPTLQAANGIDTTLAQLGIDIPNF